jgi:predicted negative regulator of RcsB-dependent stress response
VQGYTRRQLKEDKFAETAQGAAAWAAGHRSTTIGSIVLGVVVILGIVGFVTWRSHQTEQGNVALAAALRTFDTPLTPAGIPATGTGPAFTTTAARAKAAQKEFKAVADSYSYTGPARMARYMEGVAALQAGDNSAAEAILKTAGDSGDAEIAALAKLSLADLYRSTNRTADASKIYKDLADHPTATVPKTRAQLSLAEMYESSAPDQAAAIYQQIQKDNPKSVAAQIAAGKLSGGKAAPGAPNF